MLEKKLGIDGLILLHYEVLFISHLFFFPQQLLGKFVLIVRVDHVTVINLRVGD